MSLNDKWEKFAIAWCEKANRKPPSRYWRARMREAFYAGAESALNEQVSEYMPRNPYWSMRAEIDHFRSHK